METSDKIATVHQYVEAFEKSDMRSGQDSCKKFRFVQNLTRIS